eukprot:jgi/Ulvmu1/5866/UM025_0128.1
MIAPLASRAQPSLAHVLIAVALNALYLPTSALSNTDPSTRLERARVVATPDEVQAAVGDGVQHIVIRNHLDMRGSPRFSADTRLGDSVLAVNVTETIRGECNTAPLASAAQGPLPALPQPCEILVRGSFLELDRAALHGPPLWLTGLRVITAPPLEALRSGTGGTTPRNGTTPLEASQLAVYGGDLFITGCALMGARLGIAIDVSGGGRLYAADTVLSGFSTLRRSVISLAEGSTATLNHVTFRNNTSTSEGTVMSLRAPDDDCISDDVACSAATAWFHECNLPTMPEGIQDFNLSMRSVIVDDDRCQVFSSTHDDRLRHLPSVWNRAQRLLLDPTPVLQPSEASRLGEGMPFPAELSGGRAFLAPNDEAFLRVLTESGASALQLSPLPAEGTLIAVEEMDSLGGSDGAKGSIAAAVVAAVALLFLSGAAVACCVIMAWRQRRRREERAPNLTPEAAKGNDPQSPAEHGPPQQQAQTQGSDAVTGGVTQHAAARVQPQPLPHLPPHSVDSTASPAAAPAAPAASAAPAARAAASHSGSWHGVSRFSAEANAPLSPPVALEATSSHDGPPGTMHAVHLPQAPTPPLSSFVLKLQPMPMIVLHDPRTQLGASTQQGSTARQGPSAQQEPSTQHGLSTQQDPSTQQDSSTQHGDSPAEDDAAVAAVSVSLKLPLLPTAGASAGSDACMAAMQHAAPSALRLGGGTVPSATDGSGPKSWVGGTRHVPMRAAAGQGAADGRTPTAAEPVRRSGSAETHDRCLPPNQELDHLRPALAARSNSDMHVASLLPGEVRSTGHRPGQQPIASSPVHPSREGSRIGQDRARAALLGAGGGDDVAAATAALALATEVRVGPPAVAQVGEPSDVAASPNSDKSTTDGVDVSPFRAAGASKRRPGSDGGAIGLDLNTAAAALPAQGRTPAPGLRTAATAAQHVCKVAAAEPESSARASCSLPPELAVRSISYSQVPSFPSEHAPAGAASEHAPAASATRQQAASPGVHQCAAAREYLVAANLTDDPISPAAATVHAVHASPPTTAHSDRKAADATRGLTLPSFDAPLGSPVGERISPAYKDMLGQPLLPPPPVLPLQLPAARTPRVVSGQQRARRHRNPPAGALDSEASVDSVPQLPPSLTRSAEDAAAATPAFVWHCGSTASVQSAAPSSFDNMPLPDRPPPPPGASLTARKQYTEYQLNTLELSRIEILDGLVLLSGLNARILGGQAVVQFARDRRSDLPYALKFFLCESAFADEARLYTDPTTPLGRFLPRVRNIVEAGADAAVRDANGRPLPPCIAMEKGESLDLWMRRGADGVDFFTGLQIITHTAACLSRLHAAGYVHRDLKPANIMWLPRENRWTVIDFGCTARAGARAPLLLSLAYAAPEVAAAAQRGASAIRAETSMDVWSLGIVAMELLTHRTMFHALSGKQHVMDRLVGAEPLPWEEGSADCAALRKRLGHFRHAVLQLLCREPAQRPSMEAFQQCCNDVIQVVSSGRRR